MDEAQSQCRNNYDVRSFPYVQLYIKPEDLEENGIGFVFFIFVCSCCVPHVFQPH
jgi:hypothetical protein